MTTVLLIIHLFVTLALIGVVLIQRSEGGGLGVGTSQGMGSFMSGRGTANLLTRTTAILAAAFFVLSMGLALLNRGTTVGNGRSILDVPATRLAPAAVPPASPAAPPAPANLAPAPAVPPSSAPTTAVPATPAPAAPTPAAPAATSTPSSVAPTEPTVPPQPPTDAAPATPAPNTTKP